MAGNQVLQPPLPMVAWINGIHQIGRHHQGVIELPLTTMMLLKLPHCHKLHYRPNVIRTDPPPTNKFNPLFLFNKKHHYISTHFIVNRHWSWISILSLPSMISRSPSFLLSISLACWPYSRQASSRYFSSFWEQVLIGYWIMKTPVRFFMMTMVLGIRRCFHRVSLQAYYAYQI